jgi:hypothetical protein
MRGTPVSRRNERSMQFELDGVTHWLIRHAARRAPECLSSRLEEEWLADSESRRSALSRLGFAAGCCWATVVIMHEFPRSPVPAAIPAVMPAAAARGFISVADRNFGYFSLRSATLFLIVGLHAAVFCGLISTLAHTRGLATPGTLQGRAPSPVTSEIEITSLLPAR